MSDQVSDGTMPCPVPGPNGLPCIKRIPTGWTAPEGHGGGHVWASERAQAILNGGHYDATAAPSGQPFEGHLPEECQAASYPPEWKRSPGPLVAGRHQRFHQTKGVVGMSDPARPYTPDGACHGQCNHKARQALAAYQQALADHADAVDAWYRNGAEGEAPPDPEPPTIRWTPGDPLFCGRCLASTRRSLLELDTQAAQLAASDDGYRTRSADAPVTGSRGTSSVSPAMDILDKLLGDLFEIEDAWRALRGYPPRPAARGPRGAHARTRTIGWIAEHLDDILAHPDMVDLPARVFRWERVLRHLNRDGRASMVSAIRCPRPTCGERRVVWDEERHYYVCRACENVLYSDEHDRHEREQAEEAERAGRRPLVRA